MDVRSGTDPGVLTQLALCRARPGATAGMPRMVLALTSQSIMETAIHSPSRVSDAPVTLPHDDAERPRERLARHGAGALSNRELIALLLGTGSARASAFDTAARLLDGGIRGLAQRSLGDLETEHGLGRAKATRLLAALELGTRLASEGRTPQPVLRTPADTARHLLPRYSAGAVETFGVLALDVRHRVKREAVISVGCLTSSLVHPREVFQEAVVARAAALVLFHNHPSGDPEPSAEDVSLTRRLVSAGTLMGIEVLDHLVLGAGRYVSFKERGLIG
jgi:DNA repair protein RadC